VSMLHRGSNAVSDYRPACQLVRDGGALRIAVSGDWTLAVLEEAQNALQGIGPIEGGARTPDIDLAGLQMLDTAGALALISLRDRSGAKADRFLHAKPEHRVLLEEVARAASLAREAPPPGMPIADYIKRFVSGFTAIGRDAVRLTMFLGETAAALGRVIA